MLPAVHAIKPVPNAKPERESTELEIFGMEGIPPEILAAHEGDQDDEKPGKVAKVEVPPSGVGAMIIGSATLGTPPQPLYSPMVPLYPPPTSGTARPPAWPPQPPSSQPWPPGPVLPVPPVTSPRPPLPPPQPLFPIRSAQIPPAMPAPPQPPSQPPSQPLFPIRPPMPPVSAPVPPLQPLFPLNGPSHVSPSVPPTPASNVLQTRPSLNVRAASEASAAMGSVPTQGLTPPTSVIGGKPPNPPAFPGVAASSAVSSHMYASGPNTGGPCIGPPPVISNKAPGQGIANEVYLVWDDEAMSMEERRISLRQYQVHDEAFQMNSVDAAIDKRILESRLAGRMAFGV